MQVGLVVHEPEGDLGDAYRPLLDLDAVKLMDINLREAVDLIEGERLLAAMLSLKNFKFKDSQFAVGNQ